MEIIDTHAHIDQLEDVSEALARADESGVTAIFAMSVDLASMQKVLSLSQQYQRPKVFPALGIHPGMVRQDDQSEALAFLNANIKTAVAVGETGLDYWYKWVRKDELERKKQKDSFEVHLNLAREHDLPIVIHSRGAERDCLAMAQAAKVKRALFHWYSGSLDHLRGILDAGYYVSTSPSVAHSPETRAAMTVAPLDRILIETDCPVRRKQGEEFFTSEPKDVLLTWRALAALKNTAEIEVLETVNANARHFFGVE
jgi:TatD DNase family protein